MSFWISFLSSSSSSLNFTVSPLKTQSTKEKKRPQTKNFELIIINYNPENKSASSPQLNSIDSPEIVENNTHELWLWIIIVHLNTLINEASSSERDSSQFLYTNQHFVEVVIVLHILLFLFVPSANFAFHECEDGQRVN